jgi:WD40 repeat protein
LWDGETAKEKAALPGAAPDARSAAFSPDGRFLAAGAGGDVPVQVWEVATGKERPPVAVPARVVAFTPDGKALAAGGGDGTVRFVDTATWQERTRLAGHRSDVMALTFSADGKMLATAGKDETVKLWLAPPVPATPGR